MRAITHPATMAFGLANVYLLALTGPLISSGHDLVYHLTGSTSVIFVPVILFVLVLWLVLTAVLSLAERHGRFRVIAWSALVLALPWILVETFTGFAGGVVPAWVSLVVAVASVLLFAAVIGWGRLRPAFEAVQPFLATVFGCLALCGLMILAQLIVFGWEARHLNPTPLLHQEQASTVASTAAPKAKIVWILLDELSYQQVYGQRFPGLQLPAFDELAAQSTVFTDVIPAGKFTRQIIPSLLTGIPSDRVNLSGAGLLSGMHDPATGRWSRFQQHNTVFQDALDAGYSTGVDGWYNPYCRLMPAVLDRCYWTYREDIPARLSSHATIAANLAKPFRLLARAVRHLFGGGPGVFTGEQLDLRMHTGDYRHLLTAGDSLLSDPSVNFVLIHMPLPHPLGFYDRQTGRFATRHTSYIDNLALADRYLAHVHELLESEHQWDSATVVVMGDHSWRTSFIWARSAGWTPEDQAASHGGQFDPRPAYIVKLADQRTAARVSARFQAIRTRALFDALLHGQLRTPEELDQWVR